MNTDLNDLDRNESMVTLYEKLLNTIIKYLVGKTEDVSDYLIDLNIILNDVVKGGVKLENIKLHKWSRFYGRDFKFPLNIWCERCGIGFADGYISGLSCDEFIVKNIIE